MSKEYIEGKLFNIDKIPVDEKFVNFDEYEGNFSVEKTIEDNEGLRELYKVKTVANDIYVCADGSDYLIFDEEKLENPLKCLETSIIQDGDEVDSIAIEQISYDSFQPNDLYEFYPESDINQNEREILNVIEEIKNDKEYSLGKGIVLNEEELNIAKKSINIKENDIVESQIDKEFLIIERPDNEGLINKIKTSIDENKKLSKKQSFDM